MLNHLELKSPEFGLVCRAIWICPACAQIAGKITLTREKNCPECGAGKPENELSVTVAFRWLNKLQNLLTREEMDELMSEFATCKEQFAMPRREALYALLSNPGAFEQYADKLAPLMPFVAQVLVEGAVEYMMYGYSTEYVAVRRMIPQIATAMGKYAPEGRLTWLGQQLCDLGNALKQEASIPLASITIPAE
jgi:hypothetical protein